MILNIAAETMIPSAKEKLQNQKLQKIVERTYEKTRFYQENIQALGLTPTDINGVHDIHKLPFTTIKDLCTHYPLGLLTMPISGVARFEQTPDFPVASGFTVQDLICQQELIARSLVACSITNTSTLLSLPELVSSVNSRSLQQSAEMLGVTVLTGDTDNIKRQLHTIFSFGITTLFATPNQLASFARFIEKEGLTLRDLPLMNLLCEQQYCPVPIRQQLEEKFQLPLYTLYGRPDIMGIGIAGECHHQQGLHIHDDHFYPEIINPQTGRVLADHELGELVITTLSREATPLIRYRTGEMGMLTHKPCPCGRTSPRITFRN